MILPPYEVAAIVRSTGPEPLGRPVRQGQAYAVRAVDEAGEEVRVIVDARLGRVVKVIPLMEPRYAMPLLRPPAFGRPPRPVAMVPDGGIEGPEFNGPGVGGLAAGRPAGAPHEPAAQAGPPLPRPRPKLAATESQPAKPVPAAGAPQDGAKETKSNETPGTCVAGGESVAAKGGRGRGSGGPACAVGSCGAPAGRPAANPPTPGP